MNTNHKFLTILFSSLLILPLSLAAQTGGDSSDSDGIESEYEFGLFYLSDDSYRFGKYTGLTEEAYDPNFSFRIQSKPAWDSNETVSWQFQGWRLGQDSRRLAFDYLDQGTMRFTADYREIPNNRFSDGMSPFNGIGTMNLTLPSNWVGPPNGTTSSFATLDENLKPVGSSFDRRRLDLNFDRQVNRQWSFNIDWRHETKDGIRTFGGVIGNSGGNPRAVVLPSPMDFDTDIMEASFNFANSQFQFGFSLYASWFENDQTSVTWDNPYGQRSGWAAGVGFPDGQGLYSLEPSNEAMQFRAYGAVNFDNRSRLSADFSFGSMEQDDPLFNYSVNSSLAVHTPLPRTRMDAKIDTTFANLRYTAQPTNRLSVLASYTLDDRDNKTARDEWIYIGGDSQDQKDSDDARINLPYSYEKKKFDLKATWRAARGVRVKGGIESMDTTRTYSEVLGSDETKAFVGISLRKWEKASVSFDYATSERDIDGYKGNRTFLLSHLPGHYDDDDFENLPGLRKFNQTDRERDEYRFRADFFPSDKANFAISSSWYEDDYNDANNLFGLQQSEVTIWTVDAGFYPREGVTLTAYYTMESYDSEQTSRSWNSRTPGSPDDPNRNWMADSEDEVDTWNIAIRFDGLGETMGSDRNAEWGIDFTHSNVESDIMVTGGSRITATPLPTLVSEMQSWSVFGKFDINDNSAIRLAFEKQELTTRDFALDNVPIDGPSNALLLGNTSPNYDLSLITLSYLLRY